MRTLSVDEARAFYDRFGKKQDAQGYYEDAALDALIHYGDFGDAEVVYEFGCGTGRVAERLLSGPLPASACYRGRDISSTMIELSRRRLDRFGDRAEVDVSDGSMGIDAGDGSVDRVLSTYVLDLLSDEQIAAFVDECDRVLAWDGRLCLAGLTPGTTLVSRAVTKVWGLVHRLRPQIVGGCRPLCLADYLPETDWTLLHHEVIVAYGIASEVVVANPRKRRTGAESSVA